MDDPVSIYRSAASNIELAGGWRVKPWNQLNELGVFHELVWMWDSGWVVLNFDRPPTLEGTLIPEVKISFQPDGSPVDDPNIGIE